MVLLDPSFPRLTFKSDILIAQLLQDYEVKEFKAYTFKHKHQESKYEETFDVKISDSALL